MKSLLNTVVTSLSLCNRLLLCSFVWVPQQVHSEPLALRPSAQYRQSTVDAYVSPPMVLYQDKYASFENQAEVAVTI